MIISGMVKSLSEHSTITFVDLEMENGWSLQIKIPTGEPIPFQFKQQVAIEIHNNIITDNVRRIAA